VPTPQVASTTPLVGAVDVGVRDSIVFVFNTPLLASSVNEATIVLMNDDSVEAHPGTVSLSSDGLTVTFLPSKGLLEDTNYVAMAVGAAENLAGGNIKAADSTDLADTYQVAFRTTIDQFAKRGEILARDDIEFPGPIREGDPLLEVTGYLEILETSPRGFASGVDRTLSDIEVTFGDDVLPTGSHDALELTIRNVLGLDEYYGETDVDGTGRLLEDWVDSNDEDRLALFGFEPSGVIVFDGDQVRWEKHQDSPDFYYNTEVIVRVRADSIVNGTGQMLEEDVYFTFTTEYFPLYVGVEHIRLQMGRAIAAMYDDTIRRQIHAASIDAVEQAAGCFSLERPYPAVRRYVRSKTILDILDELGLLAVLKAGQRKQLGDFTVQYTPADLAKLLSAYKRAQKDYDKALFELRYYRGQRSPTWVVKGQTSIFERRDFRMRGWQHLRERALGEANTTDLRRSKSYLAADHPTLLGTYPVRVVGYLNDAEGLTEGFVYPWWGS
jgi:hypothetical protein